MIIQLKKFGTTLVSRPSGKEAWLAFQPVLNEISKDEGISVDFAEVVVLTPSWADEFLTPLQEQFKGRVVMKDNNNSSVKATLELLESVKE